MDIEKIIPRTTLLYYDILRRETSTICERNIGSAIRLDNTTSKSS